MTVRIGNIMYNAPLSFIMSLKGGRQVAQSYMDGLAMIINLRTVRQKPKRK